MAEKDDVIRKIKKLMALAEDTSASDQEIQLAIYRANKLRIKYKIEEIDLFDKKGALEDVVRIQLEHTGIGYIHQVLNVLAKYFQCETCYAGKINENDVKFNIIGLQSDVDVCVPVAEGVVYYLNSMLKDIQECYVGDVDFRIFKKDYCKGFANGLEQQLEQSLIEMNLHPKYELAVVGVPTVVKEWANKKIKVTKSKSRYVTNEEAYKLGNQHGLEYKVKRTDLLENKKHGSAATQEGDRMKNEYTVHIVIKKYLFVYLIKAWTIDKNNTLELHFKKYCMKHQIDKVEKNMCKPNFNRNNEIIGSCQGSLVLIKGTVYLNIGMLLKNIHSVPIECIGISGKGKARKISKVIND